MKYNEFYGSKLNTALLLILIILMIGALYLMFQNKETYLGVFQKKVSVENVDKTLPPLETKDGILGNRDDLISFSIWPNTKVHGVVSYRGVIQGGYFFEANILVGVTNLNKKSILQSNGVAKSDWMTTGPVSFEGNIDFTNLPKGPAYLEIHNDNASGLPQNDKSIYIPITIE